MGKKKNMCVVAFIGLATFVRTTGFIDSETAFSAHMSLIGDVPQKGYSAVSRLGPSIR